MFLLLRMRQESLLLSGLAKSLVLKKCLCFYQEICFSFLLMGHVNFRTMYSIIHVYNSINTWKENHAIRSRSSHLNYQGQC